MLRNGRICNIEYINGLFDHGLLLGLTGQGAGGGADDHGLGTKDSPTWTGATLSGLTAGSVLFAGTGGVISEDNSNLFWDDTNKKLGIQVTPTRALDVSSSEAVIARLRGTNVAGSYLDIDTDAVSKDAAVRFGENGTIKWSIGNDGSDSDSFKISSSSALGTSDKLRIYSAGDIEAALDITLDAGLWYRVKDSGGTARGVMSVDTNANSLLNIPAGQEFRWLVAGVYNGLFVIQASGNVGVNEEAPETLTEWTHATPYLTLHNSTHEDSDGGRESRLNFKGEQSGGEETTLARIEIGHDGTGNDEKGYWDLYTNSGTDGDSPTKRIRVDSNGDMSLYDGKERRYYDSGNSNYVGFKAPALTANQIWVLPAVDGSANDIIKTDGSGNLVFVTPTVDIPVSLDIYDPSPARGSVSEIHGGLLSLATAQPLNSVPTNIVVSKGIGKIMVVVNAGSDLAGDITVTGTSVNRDTGATTGADTDTITVDALTTDNSDTDTNGNPRYSFTGAYITSKWFTGSVTLSTANLTLTDVDVYHCSFEQFNDQTSLTLNTFDANIYTTNVAAEFDAYLYALEVTGDKCNVSRQASLNVGADGETAIANKYWRLRRGSIAKALDGSTDGIWVDVHYSNSPAYIEDVTLKVWATKSQTLTLA